MSTTPGRKRRSQISPVVDPTAEEPVEAPKRSRSSRAGQEQTSNFTDSPAAATAGKHASKPARASARRRGRQQAIATVQQAVVAETGLQHDMFFRSSKTNTKSAAEDPAAQPTSAVAAANGAASQPGDEHPVWHKMKGAKRLQSELKYLNKQIADGKITQLHDITPVNDNIFKWQFKLKNFDIDCEGGRNLNDDLACLAALHGQDHLLMEITFPSDYPTSPFFLRMVTPRCIWYTGHVTAGGSICIEVLTNSGTPRSWTPQMCVESIMNTVILNMQHCESVMVRTATGPGGRSGPLRVDLQRQYCYNTMQPYSEYEAQAAFQRMLSHHRTNGW